MIEITVFDPYDEDVIAQGPQAYGDLARKCPVHHYRGRFDFFIANDHGDITNHILTDPANWTIENGSSPKWLPEEQRTALMTDNAYHNKIRFVMQRGFSTVEIKRLHAVVDRLADELIDKMLAMAEGGGDIFDLLVMPLPSRLMCIMLGAPEENFMEYKEWADAYFYSILNEPDTEMSMEEVAKVSTPFFQMLAERRAWLAAKGLKADLSLLGNELPDDFLSRFMSDKIDGEYLKDDEILSLMLGIIVGGNETTMNLIGNLLWRLLEVPERWETLKARPELLEAAIEESLRIDPPVIGLFRCPRSDVELHGQVIPKDAKVMYNIAAANRNPNIWPDPDRFRLDRPLGMLRKHVAFSAGNHTCIGAPLARMEVKAVIEKLMARMPLLRIDGQATRVAGFNVYGKASMPVRWA